MESVLSARLSLSLTLPPYWAAPLKTPGVRTDASQTRVPDNEGSLFWKGGYCCTSRRPPLWQSIYAVSEYSKLWTPTPQTSDSQILAPPHSHLKPEYRTSSWIEMLLSTAPDQAGRDGTFKTHGAGFAGFKACAFWRHLKMQGP